MSDSVSEEAEEYCSKFVRAAPSFSTAGVCNNRVDVMGRVLLLYVMKSVAALGN